MAIIKHLASKNAHYGDALQYLMFEHDTLSKKPLLDDDGHLIMRQNFIIEGLECDPATFDIECNDLNRQYHQNENYDDIKSHHYIISFDPKDKADSGLTVEKAQAIGMDYAKRNFPGHQALVCTHEDGNNHSGNIHVHIVFNSVRKNDVERQDFMERNCDSRAGYKHHVTKDYLKYLKHDLMETCKAHGLNQVDLLKKSKNRRISQGKYWAERRRSAQTAIHKNCHPERSEAESKDLVSRPQQTTPDSQQPKPRAYTRKVEINKLKDSAEALAYMQEQGYPSEASLKAALDYAHQKTVTAKQKLDAINTDITALNAQIHYTGQYLSRSKLYKAFLSSKNKKQFRAKYKQPLEEYESARNWLQKQSKDQTLPSYKFIASDEGKFPLPKKLKEVRDEQIAARNPIRQQYNENKKREKELRSIYKKVEELLHSPTHDQQIQNTKPRQTHEESL